MLVWFDNAVTNQMPAEWKCKYGRKLPAGRIHPEFTPNSVNVDRAP